MAVCKYCGELFRGRECPGCGREPNYYCFNCKKEIDKDEIGECHLCGWYICQNCEECGCHERPDTKKELQSIGVKKRYDGRRDNQSNIWDFT